MPRRRRLRLEISIARRRELVRELEANRHVMGYQARVAIREGVSQTTLRTWRELYGRGYRLKVGHDNLPAARPRRRGRR